MLDRGEARDRITADDRANKRTNIGKLGTWSPYRARLIATGRLTVGEYALAERFTAIIDRWKILTDRV